MRDDVIFLEVGKCRDGFLQYVLLKNRINKGNVLLY